MPRYYNLIILLYYKNGLIPEEPLLPQLHALQGGVPLRPPEHGHVFGQGVRYHLGTKFNYVLELYILCNFIYDKKKFAIFPNKGIQ